jgi:hypothetical protein
VNHIGSAEQAVTLRCCCFGSLKRRCPGDVDGLFVSDARLPAAAAAATGSVGSSKRPEPPPPTPGSGERTGAGVTARLGASVPTRWLKTARCMASSTRTRAGLRVDVSVALAASCVVDSGPFGDGERAMAPPAASGPKNQRLPDTALGSLADPPSRCVASASPPPPAPARRRVSDVLALKFSSRAWLPVMVLLRGSGGRAVVLAPPQAWKSRKLTSKPPAMSDAAATVRCSCGA